MSGEIRTIKDSEGVSHQIDYQYLANKPFAAPTSNDVGKALVNGSNGPEWRHAVPVASSENEDLGKALVVGNSGEPEWGYILPTSGSPGDVLMLNSQEDPMWSSVLPSTANGSRGDVLQLDDHLEPVWDTVGGSLPDTTSASVGDVLVVGNTDIGWGRVLPTASTNGSDEGKALVVDEYGQPAWDYVMPVPSSNDAGKALVVDGYGDPAWRELVPDWGFADPGYVLTVADTYGNLNWMEVDVIPAGASTGDALVMGSDGPEWEAISGLPDSSGADAGDVLVVGSCEDDYAVIWASPTSLFPSFDSSDAGKSLKVNANGDGLEWA